jgi:hypothetical protein
MANDGSDLPLEGLPLLRKALEVTGRLDTDEEQLEEESEDEINDETEAPEEIEAPEETAIPEQTEAAKSAEFTIYSLVSRFPPGITPRN